MAKLQANRIHTNRFRVVTLLVAGTILFIASAIYWWIGVYNSPERLFWRAMEGNLATQGITKRITQGSTGNSVEQLTHVNFGHDPTMHARTILSQSSGEVENVIVTETIGTLKEDFIRYEDINTAETTEGGAPIDLSGVKGVWSRDNAVEGQKTGQFLREALFSTVPFAQFTPDQRHELVEFMKESKVYSPDFAAVQRQSDNGRPVYVYNVELQPQAYAAMLQRYGQLLGLGNVEEFDPSGYADAEPIMLTMTIDVLSHQITRLTTPDGRLEEYRAHGAVLPVNKPTDTISILELQERLQTLQ